MRNEIYKTSTVAVTVLLLAILPIIGLLSAPVVFADVGTYAHTSKCYDCHVSGYTSGLEEKLHNMTTGGVWTSCQKAGCHATINASDAIHSAVGCKGCHAVVHVGKFGAATYAGWLFANRVNQAAGNGLMKPTTPITYSLKTVLITQTNQSAALGSQTLSGIGAGNIRWAWVNISGYPKDITSTTRYMMCFNCHFITTNPAQAGLTKMIQGTSKIAIPEFALKLSPHALSESALKEAGAGSNSLVAFKSDDFKTTHLVLILLVIGSLFAVFLGQAISHLPLSQSNIVKWFSSGQKSLRARLFRTCFYY